MVSRVLALIAVALAAGARPAASDDLANGAFRIQYGTSGVTSLKRTADVADTDYIAANAALGRLIVRYRTAVHGDWKELRDLVSTGASASEILYALAAPSPSLASRASGSAVQGVAGIRGLNDGIVPRTGAGGGRGGGPGAPGTAADVPVFTWTPSRGATQWVQYTFPAEVTVDRTDVFWVAAPQSWRLLYQDQGQWKEVSARGPYGRETNAFTGVTFAPITTLALRIEVVLAPEGPPALAEWRVGPDPALAPPGDLSVTERFTLDGDALVWHVALANTGARALEVGDLAVPFPFAERAGAALLVGATIYLGLRPDLLLHWIGPALQSPLMQAALKGAAP